MAAERTLFRLTVAVAGLVPVCGGAAGVLTDMCMVDDLCADDTPFLRSHFRFLSGLLLGIGLAFWTTLRSPEAYTTRYRVLTAIVLLGGLARLAGVIFGQPPGRSDEFALAMELVVTPLVCLWQGRIAGQAKLARQPFSAPR